MGQSDLVPSSQNVGFVEALYEEYLQDPSSVSEEWRGYFADWSNGNDSQSAHRRLSPSSKPRSIFNPPGGGGSNGTAAPAGDVRLAAMQNCVDQLIRNYRVRGHRIAEIDPLGMRNDSVPELSPEYYGFTEEDLDLPFSTDQSLDLGTVPLKKILERLHNTYCRSIAVQYMHIDDSLVRDWLQVRMEGTENHLTLDRQEQIRILTRLTDASIFEDFIQKKFTGAKRFSLEGGESLIPLIDLAIEKAGSQGVEEIVIGMAHRGRINVLVNILGKSPQEIFREFEDVDADLHIGRGDVKYHLGYRTDWETTSGKTVHISLCFNPSHLEFVAPVVLGRTRSKQDRNGDVMRERGLALIIHGDSAIAGEGVVQETFNLSQLPGYTVGGSVHIVLNNQIGFTTPPEEARSSLYATGVAKLLQIPIFHVNGEDPEAVAQVVRLALDFRATFRRNVVIDMYCYRRYGHNEGDEPSFTQPVLTRAIEKRKSVRDGYLDHLLSLGEVTQEEADQIALERRQQLEKELAMARSEDYVHRSDIRAGVWTGYHGGRDSEVPEFDEGVEVGYYADLLEKLTMVPDDFHVHPKLQRVFKLRQEMARGERPLDWAAAEALAFASVVDAGARLRLSGQDSGRGTFSHRHAVLHDYENGKRYIPLQNISPYQGVTEIINSSLSESAVLGFDYGYSLDCPNGLVIWEAQFGDFANVAQVIIDQFIVSAEDKWGRLSGLVMLLPHGFEGMGPEHSSARLERYLSLCSENNIQVVNPTTPAQILHVLRRQVFRRWRKPLIVMTPKSLLRHAEVVSTLDDCAKGGFQRVIPDDSDVPGNRIKRILLCTGKIYYDLLKYRRENEREDIAIVRLEQLYPLYETLLKNTLSGYRKETPVYWVQEEPENMGAWRYMTVRFGTRMFDRYPFTGISRPRSASPATGSHSAHDIEQRKLVEEAFGVTSK